MKSGDPIPPPPAASAVDGAWVGDAANRRRSPWMIGLGVVLLLVLATVQLPGPPREGLDPSWQLALSRAWLTKLQFGSELIFNYGPLGFLENRVQLAELFGGQIVWAVVTRLLAGWLLWRLVEPFPRGYRICAVLLALLAWPPLGDPEATMDVFGVSVLLLAGLSLTRQRQGLGVDVVSLVLLAGFALVKFTLFLAGGLVLTLCVAHWILSRNWKRGCLFGLATVLVCAALWRICGQAWSGFPEYLRASREISVGYVASMYSPVRIGFILPALATMMVITACIAAQWNRSGRRLTHLPMIFMLLGLMLLMWKHGTTRADRSHLPAFFGFAATIGWWLPVAFEQRVSNLGGSRWRQPYFIAGLAGVLGLVSVFPKPAVLAMVATVQRAAINVRWIVAPGSALAAWNAQNDAQVKALALPQITNRLKDARVALVGFELAHGITNRWNLVFSPVIQGYQTCTPWLAEKNAAFLDGPAAPEFVVLFFRTIDNRFPTVDDSLALAALARHYRFCLEEDGFVLLQRSTETQPMVSKAHASRLQLGWGEWCVLNGDLSDRVGLSLKIEKTGWGRLWTTFFSPPVCQIEIETATGRREVFRLPPSMVEAPFLLNPVVSKSSDWAVFLARPSGLEQVVRFRLLKNGMVGVFRGAVTSELGYEPVQR